MAIAAARAARSLRSLFLRERLFQGFLQLGSTERVAGRDHFAGVAVHEERAGDGMDIVSWAIPASQYLPS